MGTTETTKLPTKKGNDVVHDGIDNEDVSFMTCPYFSAGVHARPPVAPSSRTRTCRPVS